MVAAGGVNDHNSGYFQMPKIMFREKITNFVTCWNSEFLLKHYFTLSLPFSREEEYFKVPVKLLFLRISYWAFHFSIKKIHENYAMPMANHYLLYLVLINST